MYGTLSPFVVTSIPMSRAWTIAVDSLGEVGEERALLDEVVEELLALILGRRSPSALKTFTATGRFQRMCWRPEDGRKSALADDRFDRVFLGDRRADEPERIGGERHG